MELFSLHDVCDICAVVYTKSTERIISPMAAELYHLILATELGEVNREGFSGLEKTAEELAVATEELACSAKRLAEESEDEVFQQEMIPAAESLLISGKNILLVAQKLQIQPSADNCIGELAESTKKILLETIKVLQTKDNAAVRKIIQTASWFLDCLVMLESAEDTSAMLAAFHTFSEASLLLTDLTEKFLWDLKDSAHQEHVAQCLQILKNCTAMLHTAKLNNLKYPGDHQVKLSKSYVFDLAKNTTEELISLLRNNVGTKRLSERNGLFSQHLHKLLSLLSSPEPIDLQEGNVHIEALVSFCMLLADSSRADQKVKLIRLCHHLLKSRKAIEVGKTIGFPMENQIEEKDFTMKTILGNLDQAVHTAVLYQILDSFSDTNGPLQRLTEAALQSHSLGNGGLLRKLKPLITEFFSYSHQMLKGANFVLATCTEIETIQDIKDCVGLLGKLLAKVPTLLSEMSQHPGHGRMAEKLDFLCQSWSSTMESLLMCFEKVVDLREFLDLGIQEMVELKKKSEEALANQHFGEFSCHASSLSKQATQVVEFVIRHVDRARDPIFRNGLLVLVKQLERAILQVKAAIRLCRTRICSQEAKDEYLKKVEEVIESTYNVRMGLDECNQPDILSPLRLGVRNLNISKDSPSSSPVQDLAEGDEHDSTEQNSSNNSELMAALSGKSLPASCPSQRISTSSISFCESAMGKVDLHPLITELLTTVEAHNTTQLNSVCSNLLEFSNCCVDASKEALKVAKSPESEKLLHYREIVALIPSLISLVKGVDPNHSPESEKLLQTAALLSEKFDEVKQCLMIVASSWYPFAKQLFCNISGSDLVVSKQKFDEIIETLGNIVQLAGKDAHTDCKNEQAEFPRNYECFLQLQDTFTCVQARTKHLLDKASMVNKAHSDINQLENFDITCILWSVTIQAFLNYLDQFMRRDALSLSDSKAKMGHQLPLQSTMAVLSETTLRIQEATRLSLLPCAGHDNENEIIVLREQMKTLMASLLHVANALSAPPLPSPDLSVRFQLLQRQLAITTKVLLLQLNVVNGEFLSSIQNFIRLAQVVSCDSESDFGVINKEDFEKDAGLFVENIQMVKDIIRDAPENPSSSKVKENLLSTVEHLVLLTDEVIRRTGRLQSQVDKEHLLADSILHEWSARAAYLVRQLQSTKSVSKRAVERIRRCLKHSKEYIHSRQAFYGTQSLLQEDRDSGRHQDLETSTHKITKINQEVSFIKDTNKTESDQYINYGSPAETSAKKEQVGVTEEENIDQHYGDPQSEFQPSQTMENSRTSPSSLVGDSKKWQHTGCPISQVMKQMTTQMSYMAQFLKRRGPLTTKEQLIASAAEIISGGQVLVKFASIVAKNCRDERCATELLHAVEQTRTISYQLSIVSRVNASTGRSRSSAEHLVSNAQNLIHVALQMLKMAEVACVKCSQQAPPDSEEADVAAFCSQWRKCLWWHRFKESLNSERDELGLRKTASWPEPTFTSMAQEVSAP
ncbi:uncharacterized protein LOC103280580 isoform X2 [Anolis carolinensis]|uniref:uncharacterized protein LOC103280580 isoform X2 n=1 Tax=Anolis carolinensis TaxID=28377 RepID=UPI002F2B2FD7